MVRDFKSPALDQVVKETLIQFVTDEIPPFFCVGWQQSGDKQLKLDAKLLDISLHFDDKCLHFPALTRTIALQGPIRSLGFSANRLILALVPCESKVVHIWNNVLCELAPKSTSLPHPSTVETIAWSPDARKFSVRFPSGDGGNTFATFFPSMTARRKKGFG